MYTYKILIIINNYTVYFKIKFLNLILTISFDTIFFCLLIQVSFKNYIRYLKTDLQSYISHIQVTSFFVVSSLFGDDVLACHSKEIHSIYKVLRGVRFVIERKAPFTQRSVQPFATSIETRLNSIEQRQLN